MYSKRQGAFATPIGKSSLMSRKNPVVSLSEFKAKASQFLERIHTSREDIILTQNGSATAVVQDYETYQSLKEALALMKLMVQGESDVKTGKLVPQSRVFADLKERLAHGDG